MNPQRFAHKSIDRNDRWKARLYIVCPCALERGTPTDHVQTEQDRWQH